MVARESAEREGQAAARESADGRPRSTLGGLPLEAAYGPPEGADDPRVARIGRPGEYPFTRGLYRSGYRGRPWTIRQFAGFGNATQTNERYRMILDAGGGGLSVAFDMPTLMGRDSDDPQARGEVGHCGVAIDSASDMEVLFQGIPLGEVTTSMTISGPAVPIFCMYVAAAERQGVAHGKLNGTLQTDIFKEYMAQKEWLFTPQPHLRLIGDLMEFCAHEMPDYKPLSVSGYHIREAGSTAVQELAYTLANGFAYVELGLSRHIDVDMFAPQLSFFFDAHIDFFEEIAKFRAARRIWARWMRDVYGAKTERAQWLRFHTQTAGVSLTAQQPDNNVVRTAVEALAAILGGTNSLHTNALDEVLALPSERAASIALAHAAGADGGDRADQRRRSPWRLVVRRGADRSDRGRGREDLHADQRARWRRQHDGRHAPRDRRRVVQRPHRRRRIPTAAGVRVGRAPHRRSQLLTDDFEPPLEIMRVSHEVEREQCAALSARRASRDQAKVDSALRRCLRLLVVTATWCRRLLDAARAEATLGEICGLLVSEWGRYTEPPGI